MFALLLGKMKHLNSGIAALYREARSMTSEVDQDAGQVEREC
jgi:hypothetical protein